MHKERTSVIESLSWDSDFFKHQIARLRLSTLTDQQMRAALAECKQRDIECLYATLGNTRNNMKLAERESFTPVGTRVTYERGGSPLRKPTKSQVTIKIASKGNLTSLTSLSRSLSRESRFFRDPRFGPLAAQRLYRAWTEKVVRGASPTTKVLVASVGGRCAGFVAARAKEKIVHIELVIVDKKFRGKHIGSALMEACINAYQKKGFRKFRVVTQGSNTAAQRLYQSCGFKLTAKALDYHKWFV